jgi:hypothetical protein
MRRPAALRVAALLVVLAACSSGDPESPSPPAGTGAMLLDATAADAVALDGRASPAEAGHGGDDAGLDAGDQPAAEGGDAGDECEVFGAPGQCMATSACTALGAHTSYAGHCPGPADIECCIVTPNVADDPPVPTGYVLMQQSQVTPDMTTWAVAILDDPVTYPMFSTTTQTFGTQLVLARVEWHPPDFQNAAIHRGVTLYVPG